MISKEFSVYNLNSFFAGRKMQLSYEKQIETIGNHLLEVNADLNVLPEMNDTLLQSGVLNTAPERAGVFVDNSVTAVASVGTGIIGGIFGFASNLVSNIPIVSSITSAVQGGANFLLNGVANAFGDVAGGVAKLSTFGVVKIIETTGAIRPLGSAFEHSINKPLSWLGVKEISGAPTEGLILGDHGRLKDIVGYMNSKLGSDVYSYALNGTTGTISKYKILDAQSNGAGAGGSSLLIDYDKDGKHSSLDLHVDTIHTNDSNYAPYLPRGVSPNKVTTDISVIQQFNLASGRPDALKSVVNAHDNGLYKNNAHLIAGDFNEPSHLDWIDSNKNSYDRNGTKYAWDTSKVLTDSGYSDSFREVHPDPVKDPGFTWGGPAYMVGNASWAPTADDRDRIDMIYFKDGKKIDLTPVSSQVIGSDQYFERGKVIKQPSTDSYKLSSDPSSSISDHKGVMTVFHVKVIGDITTVGQPVTEIM